MRRRAAGRSTPRVVLLVAVALAACGPAGRPIDSGVQGHVWVGPMCPVVRAGVDCPDQPLAAELEVRDAEGRVVARARSDTRGAYRIPLAAGSYVVAPLSPRETALPFAAPQAIVIQDGAWLALDIHYDSGIR